MVYICIIGDYNKMFLLDFWGHYANPRELGGSRCAGKTLLKLVTRISLIR